MRSIKLSILLVVLSSASGEAQRRSGSGISGCVGSSSSADYVRIHWGPPDSTQLVAAILFRGSTDWGALAQHERDWAERAADSASRAAESRGNQAGGTITPRATAWVEYDNRNSVVLVLNQEWRVPRRDSALVLLIDPIDRVGGDPIVEAVMVPLSPVPESHGDRGGVGRDSVDSMYVHWENALRANAKVRAFIDTMR
jgi:hypothetical protein